MTPVKANLFQGVRTLFLAALAAVFLGSTGAAGPGAEGGAETTLQNAWLRPPMAQGRPAALYFVVDNPGEATTIAAVSTSAAGRAELHTHTMDGGVMRMRQVPEIAVPAGGQAVLKPHGDHVMLFDTNKEALGAGPVAFTVTLGDGRTLTGSAEVKK